MNTAPAPIDDTDVSTHQDRLWTTAERLRLAAVALNAMSRAPLGDPATGDHIARLEQRAAELMRSVARLGEALDLAAPWGLDVLFQASAPEPPAAPIRARAPHALTRRKHRAPAPPGLADSIELTPFDLLSPEVPSPARRRRPRAAHSSPPPIPAPLGDGEVTIFDFDRV